MLLLNFSVRMGTGELVIGILGLKVWGSNPVSNSFSISVKFIGKWVNCDLSPPPPSSNLDDRFQDCFFSSNCYPFFYFFIFYNQVKWKSKKVGQRSNCFRIQFFPPFVCLSKSRLSFVQIVSTFHSVCLASFSLSVLSEVGYWKQRLYQERSSQSFGFCEPAWALKQWIVRKQGDWGNSRLCMILNVTVHARTMWWIDWGALT